MAKMTPKMTQGEEKESADRRATGSAKIIQFRDLWVGDEFVWNDKSITVIRIDNNNRRILEDESDNTHVWRDGSDTLSSASIIIGRLVGETKTVSRISFDSVILADDKKQQIIAAISQIDNHDLIFNKWGFKDVFEKGTAISLLFYGPPGCLAGDTIVEINRNGATRKVRLDYVVSQFNGGELRGRKWDDSPTFIRSHVDGYIRLVRLERALVSGIKETFTVTTLSGRSVRTTHDHPFLTSKGWKKLEELKEGDEIVCDGGNIHTGEGRRKKQYKQVSFLACHPFAIKRLDTTSPHQYPVHRLVAEAAQNGLDLQDFVELLRNGATDGLTFLDPAVWAVHHKDGNSLNNELDNLQVLTHVEHARLEGRTKTWQNVIRKAQADPIVAIERYGEEETYDLTVEGSDPNFLANGLIVHNTGKSLMSQAIADKYKKKLVMISTAEIETPEPGGAERNIKKYFAEAQESGSVLLFDECDSLITDRGRVGMILAAQINALLTELERYTGIVIFTTNRLGSLDPAFDRRLSLKLEFAMPNAVERTAIWRRMFPKKCPLASDIRWDDLGSVEIAGGHIKNVVLKAARKAAAEGASKITDDILWECLEKEVESLEAYSEALSRHKPLYGTPLANPTAQRAVSEVKHGRA